jgi:hypothetical protein
MKYLSVRSSSPVTTMATTARTKPTTIATAEVADQRNHSLALVH